MYTYQMDIVDKLYSALERFDCNHAVLVRAMMMLTDTRTSKIRFSTAKSDIQGDKENWRDLLQKYEFLFDIIAAMAPREITKIKSEIKIKYCTEAIGALDDYFFYDQPKRLDCKELDEKIKTRLDETTELKAELHAELKHIMMKLDLCAVIERNLIKDRRQASFFD